MIIDAERMDALVALAREAGGAIMRVYSGAIAVEEKGDGSPITAADRAAHEVIAAGLMRLTPHLPVLSEEGRDMDYAERSGWGAFWLVDPLDGTKEFIKRNGEFTVNIALIEGGRPVWGVVYAPALDVAFYGGAGNGAFRQRGGELAERIHVAETIPPEGAIAVKSRSHPSPELDAWLSGQKLSGEVSVGSSLKFCAVAEGRAHVYARFGPTMEWDTGAGHAVLEGAGGSVVTPEGGAFLYNKPDLRNGFFVAASSRM